MRAKPKLLVNAFARGHSPTRDNFILACAREISFSSMYFFLSSLNVSEVFFPAVVICRFFCANMLEE